ncbi:hypothetical protein EYF80_042968 [Liparis tanakae]|uniref:Uncharacterized protein n=1 Tax=Liparis tanakae TaxID=230148 RepID=A0A4Z2FZQ5_9TELE|nr:hypothetical protein EYF80_042968 [Liparis tanakae]
MLDGRNSNMRLQPRLQRNQRKCSEGNSTHSGQKGEPELVTEETPPEFSTVSTRSRPASRKRRWRTDEDRCREPSS